MELSAAVWGVGVNWYQQWARPVFFSGMLGDAEQVHQRSLAAIAWLDRTRFMGIPDSIARFCQFDDPRLTQTLWGIEFPNPVGLAAGFDKDGEGAGLWDAFGFGFAELGTVTYHPQPGNPKPRLFRLVEDEAVLNRMGFNNAGSAALQTRLAQRSHPFPIPIGINLGKSKITPLEAAAADYLGSFERLQDWGDYFVVNVSSPNTPGLRSHQARDQLEPIFAALQTANTSQKPMLVKIAPDLADGDILDVVAIAQQYALAGIIATNTTIRRDLTTTHITPTGQAVTTAAGGISGRPVRSRSTDVIRLLWQETQGTLPIIGVGGIFSAADAWEKITAGASLVQLYTGWIYQGPLLVRQILTGLLAQLDAHNLPNLEAAIGSQLPPQ
jgi:dihydroorotate dehydrogenase